MGNHVGFIWILCHDASLFITGAHYRRIGQEVNPVVTGGCQSLSHPLLYLFFLPEMEKNSMEQDFVLRSIFFI